MSHGCHQQQETVKDQGETVEYQGEDYVVAQDHLQPWEDKLVADALSRIETGLLLLNEAVQDTYGDDWMPMPSRNRVYRATQEDAALTRLLNILQRGLPHPSFPSTGPPAQSCMLPTLTPPTVNINTPPEVATVADTAPTVDHYSGLTDSMAESSRKSNNLNPASLHSTVRQQGWMYNNQDYTLII